MQLQVDENGFAIPAFPLTAGKINITTGTIPMCRGAVCAEDGSITLVTYGVTVAMVAGDVYSFKDQDVTVVLGKFHLA